MRTRRDAVNELIDGICGMVLARGTASLRPSCGLAPVA
jgi:hypothetical protein